MTPDLAGQPSLSLNQEVATVALVIIPVGFMAVAIALVVFMYKAFRSKSLAVKTESTRAKALAQARAHAAEESAERATGLAEKAVDRAEEIHEVNGKVDVLLAHVVPGEPGQPRRGKHAGPDRDAVVVPLEQRYIA